MMPQIKPDQSSCDLRPRHSNRPTTVPANEGWQSAGSGLRAGRGLCHPKGCGSPAIHSPLLGEYAGAAELG